ncbi:Permuted papain-like amidase enzyme, YaeF/YiiX, C92 family [Prosthecobacter debontii]|uniref:Permuted papain-like amidase enzyme, YaeF/YiiX, C92 family n=2 Tax=Prosthecobacter debontii TaxID=48467 RepID=A0A1T4WHG5_9BACT|nr:Permuted papain-like amidase enzyme, YaeF/YiiX, C92 family [Prosthecobacter debontii]
MSRKALSRSHPGKFPLHTGMKPLLTCLIVALSTCSPSPPKSYLPREADIVFQSLPHSPLVDAIEGCTHSPYSHCGILAFKANEWVVIEALGTVRETSWPEWAQRGRKQHFTVYRLDLTFSNQTSDIVTRARSYLGRPYDLHYSFDDEAIYCSELIQKAIRGATGRTIGKIQKLSDLNWKPFETIIRTIENDVPLDREMITPQSLAEATELHQVYSPIAADD